MLEVKKTQTNNARNHTLPEQQYKKIPSGVHPKHTTGVHVSK